MNKIKIGAFGIASATALILLAACGNSGASKNASSVTRDINYSWSSDLLTLDSSLASDATAINTLLNVESGLVRTDKNGNPANDLAKSIEVSKDGLTYNVTLRSGLKWSNGEALTAKDFVYGWQRTVDPKTQSEYASSLYPLKNAEQINLGKAPVSTLGVKAVSDTKLVITLDHPTPYFLKLLSLQCYYPLNEKFVEKYGKSYGTTSGKTLYSGPFKFATGSKAWTGSNKSFALVKNPDYYNAKKVKAKGISYQVINNTTTAAKLFKEGKLDIASLDTPELVSAYKDSKEYTILPAARDDLLEFNQSGKVPALSNLKIRQALSLAFNRKALLDTAAPYYTVLNTATPAGLDKAPNGQDFAKYAAQPYTYDAKKAKTLFEEGLKELGKKSLTLTIEGDSDVPYHKTALDFLKQNWQKELPGLTIEEKLVPKAQRLQDGQNNNFEIIWSSWGADYNEPSDFLMNYATGNALNDGRFSNAAFDKAWKAATTTPDITNPKKLYADYKAAEQALYDQANIFPVDTEAKPVLFNANLKGVSKLNSGSIWDLSQAYLTK